MVHHELHLRLLRIWQLGLLLEHLLQLFSWDNGAVAVSLQLLLHDSIINVTSHAVSAAVLTPDLVFES